MSLPRLYDNIIMIKLKKYLNTVYKYACGTSLSYTVYCMGQINLYMQIIVHVLHKFETSKTFIYKKEKKRTTKNKHNHSFTHNIFSLLKGLEVVLQAATNISYKFTKKEELSMTGHSESKKKGHNLINR
jgi:hypothetical protein